MNQTTKNPSDDIPDATWNNGALFQAWKDCDEAHRTTLPMVITKAALAEVVVNRFMETVGAFTGGVPVNSPHSYLVATSGGHWGRGALLYLAANAASEAGARNSETALAWLVLNDSEPYVDSNGTANASSAATMINLGKVGTIGSILRANKNQTS